MENWEHLFPARSRLRDFRYNRWQHWQEINLDVLLTCKSIHCYWHHGWRDGAWVSLLLCPTLYVYRHPLQIQWHQRLLGVFPLLFRRDTLHIFLFLCSYLHTRPRTIKFTHSFFIRTYSICAIKPYAGAMQIYEINKICSLVYSQYIIIYTAQKYRPYTVSNINKFWL